MRKITINGELFLWRFSYSEQTYAETAFLALVSMKNRNCRIRIYFPLPACLEKNMLNLGFKVLKNGADVVLNLNRPKYAAEIIQVLFDYSAIDLNVNKTYEFLNGFALLTKAGYVFDF